MSNSNILVIFLVEINILLSQELVPKTTLQSVSQVLDNLPLATYNLCSTLTVICFSTSSHPVLNWQNIQFHVFENNRKVTGRCRIFRLSVVIVFVNVASTLITLERGWMYSVNNTGPGTKPWGMPCFRGRGHDLRWSTAPFWSWAERKKTTKTTTTDSVPGDSKCSEQSFERKQMVKGITSSL